MAEFIFVIYKENTIEIPPDFIQEEYCEYNVRIVEFKSFISIFNSLKKDGKDGPNIFWSNKKKWLKEKFNNNNFDIILLSHGLHNADYKKFRMLYKLISEDDCFKLYFDYSGADPNYGQMWDEIRKCKNCNELVNCIEFWIKYYSVDPIRRLKHRFINSFQSLSIDLGKLIELIEENDVIGLKKHIGNLSEYWKGKNDGPLYKLISFWYALVGKDGLTWGEGSLPAKPDVHLSKKKDKELTIYFHLKELFGAEKTKQMQEWVKLLDHCQLYQVCEGKFDINENISGIYMKSKELEQLIGKVLLCKEEIEELRTNEEVKELRANSEYFIKWLNKLNELMEALIKACS
jgi:hypothetical protein